METRAAGVDGSQLEVVETHLSRVYLGDGVVYKVLKPVKFAFVDQSTRALRQHACAAEIAHNTPWAPGVYLGVVGVRGGPEQPSFGAPEAPEDFAIQMVRLPDEQRLDVRASTLEVGQITQVGQRIREVHPTLQPRPDAAHPDHVRQRISTNLDELEQLDPPLPSALLRRIRAALQSRYTRVAEELEARASKGQALHGDLRAEHVYLLPDGVTILDGVAFDPALAEGDPLEDIAFLAMELTCKLGRWDLEAPLWAATGTTASAALRDLYVAHRSLIRAKIAVLQAAPERALRHVVHALSRLEPARERPALIGVGGLPGTGKSTLARAIAEPLDFEVIRTDVVRKQQLGAPDYSDAGRTRVYTHTFEQAATLLARGGRVVIDGSFERRDWRDGLDALGLRFGLQPLLLLCDAPAEVVEARLRARVDDASDADVQVYRRAREVWEAVSPTERTPTQVVSTLGPTLPSEALEALTQLGVVDPTG